MNKSLSKHPTIAIVGHGRCGKDTAGLFLKEHTVLRFEGGCSWAGRHYMAERLSVDYGRLVTPEEAYATRHGAPGEDPVVMRTRWYDYLNEYRAADPARLIKLVLETSDFVCGVRDRKELLAVREQGLLDLICWVERPGIPVDPTVTFTRADCDLVVMNDGTLDDYLGRWRRLASALKILKD